jgi:hypothetical protein
MKLSRFSQAVLLVLLALMLSAVTVSAKDGRDFAGFYSVSNVVDQGDQIFVTLRVQLFNHSDADVTQAVLTLRQNPGGPLGTFQPVKLWRNHGEVRLTQQFVVPKHEFERWYQGVQPALMVVTHDENGQRHDRFVQISRRPALPQ